MAVVLALALIGSACGGETEEATPTTTVPPTTRPAETTTTAAPTTTTAPTTTVAETTTTTGALTAVELPDDPSCVGVDGGPAGESELTFVTNGYLWAIDAGFMVTCLAEVDSSDALHWSPLGNKVVLADGTVHADGTTTPIAAPLIGDVIGWTWPTGLRFLATDGPTFTKYEADGSGRSDASIADDHRVLAYHPDGMHVAVYGTTEVEFEEFDENGDVEVATTDRTALFIVRNGDPTPHVMIDPIDGEIHDVVFSEDGTRLTFVADHGGVFHIHSLNLPDMLIETDEEVLFGTILEEATLLNPQVESDERLDDLVVDPSDPGRFLFTDGGSVRMYDVTAAVVVEVLPDFEGRPLGFLDSRTAAVLTTNGELWIADLVSGDRRFITEVDSAAVRSVAPELALSLVDIVIVGFA